MSKKTDGATLPRAIKLQPSASKRWLQCPAFPVLGQWVDDERTDSPWLLEGTYAHRLAEICLRTGDEPREYIEQEVPCTVDEGTRFERTEIFVPDVEMVGAVNIYLQFCDDCFRYVRGTDGILRKEIEEKVGFVSNRISVTGTPDYLVVSPKRLLIVDFKYGQNVEVEAVDNEQLTTYALGAVNRYKPGMLEEIVLVIVQPRLVTGGPTIKRWDIPNAKHFIEKQTAKFDERIRAIVEQGERGELVYNPSPSVCQWCDSMVYCRGLWRYVKMIIENIGIDVPELDQDKVREILLNSKPIRDFIYAIERHATTRALNGERFDGFKLVEGGRAPVRTWNDAKKVLRLLDRRVTAGDVAEDKVFSERSPLTPAKIEKVLGKEFVEKYASRPASDRPTILVPDSDRRKPIATAADEFAELLDGDDDVDLDEFDI